MKAWHIGAIIGGLIGLTKVMDSIFYPAIGAMVGGTVFQFVFWLFTGKVKLWKKGGIIGAVWGLVTSLWWYMLGFVVGGSQLSILSSPVNAIHHILTFPGYVTFLITVWKEKKGYVPGHSGALFIFFVPALVLGLLIGALIGYLIEKRKMKK